MVCAPIGFALFVTEVHREGSSGPPGALRRKTHAAFQAAGVWRASGIEGPLLLFGFARLAVMPPLLKACVAPFVWMLGCGTTK